jgi:hypothetical protein
MTNPEKTKLAQLALGRIFRLASRPAQPGDIEEYHRCRAIILDALEPSDTPDYILNWARDRLKGAQGD